MKFTSGYLITTVSHPRELRLERQLNNSVLIAWLPPMLLPADQIESYHVYIDGTYKSDVKSTERTKALVESIDANKVIYMQLFLRI